MRTGDGKLSWPKLTGQAVVLIALIGGLVGFAGANKNVTLMVNGEQRAVQTFGGTVQDVLSQASVNVGASDQVTPALDTAVANGTEIKVSTPKEVSVTLDGAQTTVQTTVDHVGDLVSELGVSGNVQLSASQETALNDKLQQLSISTEKRVEVIADGSNVTQTTTASTVDELLSGAGVQVGPQDVTSLPGGAPVVPNMVVKVSRMSTGEVSTVTEDVPFKTEQTVDPEAFKDEKKVTRKGTPGKLEKSFAVVSMDGREVSRKLTGEKTLSEPVSEQVTVGGKDRPKPEAPKPAEAAGSAGGAAAGLNWAALAQCESTGNPRAVNPAGYYGLYQFSLSTWASVGGTGNPIDASPAEQLNRAQILYNKAGAGQWGCGANLFR